MESSGKGENYSNIQMILQIDMPISLFDIEILMEEVQIDSEQKELFKTLVNIASQEEGEEDYMKEYCLRIADDYGANSIQYYYVMSLARYIADDDYSIHAWKVTKELR